MLKSNSASSDAERHEPEAAHLSSWHEAGDQRRSIDFRKKHVNLQQTTPTGFDRVLETMIRAVLMSRPLRLKTFLAELLEAELNKRTLNTLQEDALLRQSFSGRIRKHTGYPSDLLSSHTGSRLSADSDDEDEEADTYEELGKPASLEGGQPHLKSPAGGYDEAMPKMMSDKMRDSTELHRTHPDLDFVHRPPESSDDEDDYVPHFAKELEFGDRGYFDEESSEDDDAGEEHDRQEIIALVELIKTMADHHPEPDEQETERDRPPKFRDGNEDSDDDRPYFSASESEDEKK